MVVGAAVDVLDGAPNILPPVVLELLPPKRLPVGAVCCCCWGLEPKRLPEEG